MNLPTVLIIDDESKLVTSLVYGLKAHGIHARGALCALEGIAAVARDRPDLVLLDLRLPDRPGIEVLQQLLGMYRGLPVAVISAHGDIRVAVEAIKVGAIDFVTKPFDLDDIITLVRTVAHGGESAPSHRRHSPQPPDAGALVGTSACMEELHRQVAVVAASSARVILLQGKSGTGKGLISRLLHAWSPRSAEPFVTANCAALPEALIEAELFGAERGAYTGAGQRRQGLVELAGRGTLFLDEIAELALPLQAKLLLFMESRRFRPLGSPHEREADVRIIAATNRELAEEVRAGRFRADLFYRLNVVPIRLPLLAEHRADILPLLEHFAARSAAAEAAGPIDFDGGARRILLGYGWPGNVRELAHLVERLTILHPGQTIDADLLPAEIRGLGPEPGADIDSQLAAAERDIVLRALREAGGRKGRAAEELGISRHALKRRLQRLKIADGDGEWGAEGA